MGSTVKGSFKRYVRKSKAGTCGRNLSSGPYLNVQTLSVSSIIILENVQTAIRSSCFLITENDTNMKFMLLVQISPFVSDLGFLCLLPESRKLAISLVCKQFKTSGPSIIDRQVGWPKQRPCGGQG